MGACDRVDNRTLRNSTRQKCRAHEKRWVLSYLSLAGYSPAREKCSSHIRSVYERKCLPRRICSMRVRAIRWHARISKSEITSDILPRSDNVLEECDGAIRKNSRVIFTSEHFDRCEICARISIWWKSRRQSWDIQDPRQLTTVCIFNEIEGSKVKIPISGHVSDSGQS